ncbi:MAG: hypothetical protein COA92_08255 [Sulfurovum sp.]|nr:MAG: hypothetical protein COA92_08255 [Sulfurovum sp.]
MMFVPSSVHHHTNQGSTGTIPSTFGVFCWNVHKKNTVHSDFKPYLQTIMKEKKVDFLLFQEANFRNKKHCILSDFSFDAAANLEVKGKFYGVLSASRVRSLEAQAYLSEGRESFIGTYKSLLLSLYPFDDKSKLLILNVHIINFRETRRFSKELERMVTLMSDHKGPIIIAGDFNTWNKKRMQKLNEIREKLSLERVPFKQTDKVKSFMGNHLDFIFYKGLELIDYRVYKEHGISDHNPLFATFRKK